MNIYLVNWTQSGAFDLSAVVIANSEAKALAELDLDAEMASGVVVTALGACTTGADAPKVVCQESL